MKLVYSAITENDAFIFHTLEVKVRDWSIQPSRSKNLREYEPTVCMACKLHVPNWLEANQSRAILTKKYLNFKLSVIIRVRHLIKKNIVL